MPDTRHMEMMLQSLEQRLVSACDQMREQMQAVNAVLVQMEGMAYRLSALETELEAMKNRPRMGLRIGPETMKRLIQIGAILALLALNAPDSHVGWVLSWLK